jgi:hypothetical protein
VLAHWRRARAGALRAGDRRGSFEGYACDQAGLPDDFVVRLAVLGGE